MLKNKKRNKLNSRKNNERQVRQLVSRLGELLDAKAIPVCGTAAEHYGKILGDAAFFQSAGDYFDNIAMSLAGAEREIQVTVSWDWETDDTRRSFYNNRHITANANWGMLKGLARPERFLALHGMVYHEAAHILYTDVSYRDLCRKKAVEGVLYPEPDVECEALKQMLASGKHTNAFLEIWLVIWNALEDRYAVNSLFQNNPSFRFSDGIRYMDQLYMSGLEPLAGQKGTEDTDRFITILKSLARYARYRILPDDKKDERIQAVMNAVPYVNEAVLPGKTEDHYRFINNVVASLQDYLLPYLESLPEEDSGNGFCNTNGVSAGLNRELKEILQKTGLTDCDYQVIYREILQGYRPEPSCLWKNY